ncbi:MAG TPA: helix-turn-helix domain-containing protein [Phototrophicaceae bacterium]|jgi:Zn finger protein HypA/HybF involved in hydrogenase expression|nr:helix-turn-helix domain-containing protein [Phototrophicaceae bacterium]
MEREKLIEYLEKGYNNSEIARADGRSDTTVRKWIRRYGLQRNPTPFDPILKPRKTCARCDNLVERNTFTYCRECINNGFAVQKLSHQSLADYKTDKHRKIRLLKDRACKCESCGLTEWLGQPIKLELHHVDGNSDNNVGENLQLLCPNCHSLTLTYRAKNKGSESRRKIYRKRYYYS